jgi:hypothetical protein
MWGKRAAVAAGALLLTLGVTWPLARCPETCLGASVDPIISVYYLRWVAHSLTTPGSRLLDAPMFAPYPDSLLLGEYLPAYQLVALPTILFTGSAVLAHNVVLGLAYALAALGAAALAARLLGPTPAALLAGVAFAYSPRFFHQAHNLQALSAVWVPWLLLALARYLARPTWGAATAIGVLGLGLAGSSMIGFMYAGVAALVTATAAVAWGGRRLGRAHLVPAVAVGLPAAALVALYVAPYRRLALEWRLGRTLAEVERYSASLGDYLGVPPEHFLHRLTGIGRVVDLDREALFPGLVVTLLAAVGLWATLRNGDGLRRRLGPYAVMGVVSAVLALGPTWHSGSLALPLPYRALYALVPGFGALRTPRRFGVLVALALALLAAAGAQWLVRRLPSPRAALFVGALATLALLESIAVPFPGTVVRFDPRPLPEAYQWLEAQDPRTVMLGVPTHRGIDVWGPIFHLRRTVSGISSYMPPHYWTLVEAMRAFPDGRSIALAHGIRPDVIVIHRGWLTPARAAVLADPGSGFRLEREFATHLVYRLGPPGAAGLEALEATAVVERVGAGPSRACATLKNPGSGFVPLYPVHRLRLEVDAGSERVDLQDWLPLDLAPGATHSVCAQLATPVASARIRGEVESLGRTARFEVATDAAPVRLRAGSPPRP